MDEFNPKVPTEAKYIGFLERRIYNLSEDMAKKELSIRKLVEANWTCQKQIDELTLEKNELIRHNDELGKQVLSLKEENAKIEYFYSIKLINAVNKYNEIKKSKGGTDSCEN